MPCHLHTQIILANLPRLENFKKKIVNKYYLIRTHFSNYNEGPAIIDNLINIACRVIFSGSPTSVISFKIFHVLEN